MELVSYWHFVQTGQLRRVWQQNLTRYGHEVVKLALRKRRCSAAGSKDGDTRWGLAWMTFTLETWKSHKGSHRSCAWTKAHPQTLSPLCCWAELVTHAVYRRIKQVNWSPGCQPARAAFWLEKQKLKSCCRFIDRLLFIIQIQKLYITVNIVCVCVCVREGTLLLCSNCANHCNMWLRYVLQINKKTAGQCVCLLPTRSPRSRRTHRKTKQPLHRGCSHPPPIPGHSLLCSTSDKFPSLCRAAALSRQNFSSSEPQTQE